jgi:hypothetical protein
MNVVFFETLFVVLELALDKSTGCVVKGIVLISAITLMMRNDEVHVMLTGKHCLNGDRFRVRRFQKPSFPQHTDTSAAHTHDNSTWRSPSFIKTTGCHRCRCECLSCDAQPFPSSSIHYSQPDSWFSSLTRSKGQLVMDDTQP